MKKITFCCLAMATPAVWANPDTILVFDASGSMWGQIDGVTKIEIARDAVSTISQGFAAEQTVGLMAYGHRRKGDCADIETLVEPAAGTAQAIAAQVQQLQPKGKTPLSQAVVMAADSLKYTENQATVVLITDGVETCDRDPCAVAAELEQLGVDFTAHVVGFGLSADQGKQLSCMADITGGRYLPAADAQSLNQALQQVVLAAEEPVATVELPTAEVLSPSEPVVIGAGFAVKWTGPAGEQDYIDVVPVGDDRVYGELAYQWANTGSPAQLRAPGQVGEYELRYIWQGPKQKHILARAPMQVVDSDVSLLAPAKVAAASAFEVTWQGPNRNGDYVDLVKRGDQRTYGELGYFYTNVGPTGTINAPAAPGKYDVRYVMEAPDGRQILHRIPVEVEASAVTLAFQPQAEVAAKITVNWSGPNNAGGYIDVVKQGYTHTYGEISYFYLEHNPESGELLMPVEPGEYQIRFVMQGSKDRQVLASEPITVTAVPAILALPGTAAPGSTIQVQWTGPNRQGDYVDLMPADRHTLYGEITYFYTEQNPGQGQLTMPEQAGQYKVRYVLQGRKRLVLAEQTITVQ
ncbi:vWA domain-containing protein [Marinicella meishanensis]|uniref:vWA domain-containing protein n=1 Tax=Marinicella meishanensis TaxID=2873263 RepID=UPI001CBEE22F|nr:VWA domain-containing protein [Marinicella sp. NBU2979]